MPGAAFAGAASLLALAGAASLLALVELAGVAEKVRARERGGL